MINIVLIGIMLTASVLDIATKRIPNWLVFPAMAVGGILTWPADIVWKIIGVAVVFLVGMLGIAGMGDIKLWMAVIMFTGLRASLLSIMIACALFFIFEIIRRRVSAVSDVKFFTAQLFNTKKAIAIRDIEHSLPFAPFFTVGVFMVLVLNM